MTLSTQRRLIDVATGKNIVKIFFDRMGQIFDVKVYIFDVKV